MIARPPTGTTRRSLAATAAVAALVLVGCGGSDEGDGGEGGGGDAAELTRFLPADATVLTRVDLAEARAQLELPDDADALATEEAISGGIDPASPEGVLLSAAALGMPPLTLPLQTLAPDAVAEAFDGGAITAAASAQGEADALTAIATGQSFDDLAGALESEGYELDGDVLTATDPDARIAEIVDAGDGVILLAGAEGAGADAASEPSGGPADLLDVIEPADEPLAQASTALDSECLVAFGGWESADLSEGTISLVLDREADAEAVELGELGEAETVSTEEPVADGESVEIAFTTTEERGPSSLVRDLMFRFGTNLYDCG